MPKATTPTASTKRRHNPLEQDLLANGILTQKKSKRQPKRSDEDGENFLDARASRKVLELGAELLEEEERLKQPVSAPAASAFDFDPVSLGHDTTVEEDKFDDDGDEAWGDEDEVIEEGVNAEDLEVFNSFNNAMTEDPPLWDAPSESSGQRQGGVNLVDLILAKIAEKEGQMSRPDEPGPVDEDYELPPKVIEVFTKIGEILKRYRSGPLPKPFKVLPTIPHFEDILDVTQPDQWSANAVLAATRIFISSKPIVATRFIENVLLSRVRDDIYETKKLNTHLFNAIKKSLYKPAAFFKGLLFPLVASGTATQREATIISAALVRTSIPVLHSAAALKTLCDIAAEQTPRSSCFGATNIFIKVLLEKKYALPYQVIDSLVFFFVRSREQSAEAANEPASGDAKSLPVLWHLALLAFAQRYRNDITEDQREALLDLLLNNGNQKIAPEIRKELLAGRGRGVPAEQEGPAFDGDNTMLIDS